MHHYCSWLILWGGKRCLVSRPGNGGRKGSRGFDAAGQLYNSRQLSLSRRQLEDGPGLAVLLVAQVRG